MEGVCKGTVGVGSGGREGVGVAKDGMQDGRAVLPEAVAGRHESEDRAWRRYGAEADREMAKVAHELSGAEAQLRVEQAKSRSQLSAALQQEGAVRSREIHHDGGLRPVGGE